MLQPYTQASSLGRKPERRFSAELSHELRTPLAKLIAEAELALRRDRTPEAYREALAVILRNGQQLTRTVETLITASQQELGPTGTSDGYTAAAEVVDACAGVSAENGVALSLDRPVHPVRVGVDTEVVERVLQPVVENACRYATTYARVSMHARNGAVIFVVEDDGPGLADGERELIFEPGVRGRAAERDGAPAGAGLGLALARRLARSASGEVAAESNGGGARFVVSLPAA
jgi:two-component system, OmpR family, sensor kinase